MKTIGPTKRSYPKLLAPKGDGEMLLWPNGRQLIRDTVANHGALSGNESARIAGIPAGQLRRWMRRWMGHAQDGQPIIATGHQTELYHAGVWIKNAAIDAAARRIGGTAMHFAVDTDAPKHLVYRWAGGGRPITDDANLSSARWSGLLKPPTPGYVREVRSAAAGAVSQWNYAAYCDEFFDTLETLADRGVTLSEAIANAHHATDRSLGLRHQVVIASSLTRSAGYLLFVWDIASRADEYVAVYNGALAEFRRENGITSIGRPMPDLHCDGESCEIPFWLDDLLSGDRWRATLTRRQERWALVARDQEFQFDPSEAQTWSAAERLGEWLNQLKLRLSPRALTLTSFLRLAVVDQFVHGIGGAIYDRVTDALLERWYGLARPPAFSVATLTLYFPAAEGRARTCLECIAREARSLRNGLLGSDKIQIVQRIAQAPRRSAQRAMLFSQMHRDLDEAMKTDPRIPEFTRRFGEAREAAAMDNLLFDRELPYSIQSRQRLERAISQMDAAFR